MCWQREEGNSIWNAPALRALRINIYALSVLNLQLTSPTGAAAAWQKMPCCWARNILVVGSGSRLVIFVDV